MWFNYLDKLDQVGSVDVAKYRWNADGEVDEVTVCLS